MTELNWGEIMRFAKVLPAVTALAFVGACSTPRPATPTLTITPSTTTAATPTFTLSGTFGIYADPATVKLTDGAPCQGAGAGAGITAGSTVTVYTTEGKLLATGLLGPGIYKTNVVACVFKLVVPNVPEGLPTYGVEVGQTGVHEVSSTLAHGAVLLFVGP